jgi:hypothetical protein
MECAFFWGKTRVIDASGWSAINRAWVLGDERFKQQIEKQTGRRVSPLVRGGQRDIEPFWFHA